MTDFGTAAAAAGVIGTGTSTGDEHAQQLDAVGGDVDGRRVSDVNQDLDTCPSVYGFLVERGDGQRTDRLNLTICGGGRRREREVYQTDGHVVQMTSTVSDVEQNADSSGSARYFLIRFEGMFRSRGRLR